MAVKKKAAAKSKAPASKSATSKAPSKKSSKKAAAESVTETAPEAETQPPAAAKKTRAKKAAATAKALGDAMTKTDVINTIAQMNNMTQKDVGSVFAAMKLLIERHMAKKGSGEFTIPDAGVKIHRVRKAASKPRNGHNPYTGEAMLIPAKKARNVVRVSALKFLKDAVQ